MGFICLLTRNKSSEDAAAQALLHARGPDDLQPLVRISQSFIFTAVVARTVCKEDCDLMHRYQLLDMIAQPFLPHICTVTEQLLEIATGACFKWAQVFPHCTARQAAALASLKPTPVRQYPLCSHLPKAGVFAACCPESPPHCTCALPVLTPQPSPLPTLHGLDRVLKVTYSTNLSLISFFFLLWSSNISVKFSVLQFTLPDPLDHSRHEDLMELCF